MGSLNQWTCIQKRKPDVGSDGHAEEEDPAQHLSITTSQKHGYTNSGSLKATEISAQSFRSYSKESIPENKRKGMFFPLFRSSAIHQKYINNHNELLT